MPTATTDSAQLGKKKEIFAVGPSTFVTIRNNSNVNPSSNQVTEKISLTKVNFSSILKKNFSNFS